MEIGRKTIFSAGKTRCHSAGASPVPVAAHGLHLDISKIPDFEQQVFAYVNFVIIRWKFNAQ